MPVSVSIFSNMPDYGDKPIFLCNDKPDVLIHEFIQTILKISIKAKSINENKYNGIITFLDSYVNNIQKECDRFKERIVFEYYLHKYL